MPIDRSGWPSRDEIAAWREANGGTASLEPIIRVVGSAHDLADEADRLRTDYDLLVSEISQAEAFEQKMRQFISEAITQFGAGHPANALSLLNEALREFDDQTDVVAPSSREGAR